jgi:hypothetical protein
MGLLIYLSFGRAANIYLTNAITRSNVPLLSPFSDELEWAQEHQDELLENWNSIKESGKYHKIQPLVSEVLSC